jgi:phosphoesterase RecJ-like protein
MIDNTLKTIASLVNDAKTIVIIQADNPDADSLGSALALEQIFGEAKKSVHLYCGVMMPQYLHHLDGWSRVSDRLPSKFDLSIIVDTSASSLLQKLSESGHQGWISSRPCIVLDHHAETENDISYATVVHNDSGVSSTGELIYHLAKSLDWPIDISSGESMMSAILGDTQGLTNDLARSNTYAVMSELVELGVSRPKLEELRREYSKMDSRIFRYKARLIERTELLADGKLALVTIPQEEINSYSPLYNPAPLIQGDMLQTIGVGIAIVLKSYDDGKVLASIRCNQHTPIAADLALRMGGGGHRYAAGFKVQDGRPFNEIKSECISIATELLQTSSTIH